MTAHERPRVIVSRCIEFDRCRWNGLMITSEIVKKLKEFVDFETVCPEVGIGLGVPRKPIRLVGSEKKLRLVQPDTGKDLTADMTRFSSVFLEAVGAIDGFILKDRSPTCGNKDVKIYPKEGKVAPVTTKGSGIFGGKAAETFPRLAIETEGRLNNFRIREHFLTKLFLLARFRTVKESDEMGGLVAFHTENKLLLMAYNQAVLRELGRIVANPEHREPSKIIGDYETLLARAFARASRHTSNINVLMHALGYFKEGLNTGEKSFFLDTLERYRDSKVPLSVCIEIIRSWVVRFQEPYLSRQTYFSPYPEALVAITDSGKGRDAP